MDLIGVEAIKDAAPRLLQLLGPVDVVLFVKPGPQLDHDRNILAILCGVAQVLHQLGPFGQTVDGDFDGDNRWVVRRLPKQMEKGLHRLIGIGQQHVMAQDLACDVLPRRQPGGKLGREGGIGQFFPQGRRELVRQREYISHFHRGCGNIHLGSRQVQALAEILLEPAADRTAQLQPDGGQLGSGAQQLSHLGPEILIHLEGLVVGGDIGVAGDTENRLFHHFVAPENLLHLAEQNICRMNIAHLGPRQEYHLRQRGGHWDKAEHLPPLIPEQGAYMEYFVY